MREESATPDVLMAEIAARQHGVVTTNQLLAAGINKDGVLRRLKAGRLHRVHRGVYAVGHVALSTEARWMAAVLACGEVSEVVDTDSTTTILDYWGAALSHRSAAALWGILPLGEGLVHVSIHGDGGRRRRKGIRLHRSASLLPATVTLRSGILVTKPSRTITDLRQSASGPRDPISARELRRAIRQAEVLELPLDEEVESDDTRSDLERDFLLLCRRHALPTPEVNVRVKRHLVDFLWREQMVIVETDGYDYHRGRIAFQDDRARVLDLRTWGFDVIRVAEKQVNEESRRVAEVVGAALRVRADGR